MWLRRKASSPTTFQKRLEQKNPYLFIEYWKEGASPFKWSAEWEHLSLEISDIRISVSQQYLDRKFGQDQQSIPLAKFDEWPIPKDVSDDQKKAYLEFVSNLFNDAFTKPDSERTAVVSGKFTTEENRDIGFIRSGESEAGRRTAREGYISIHSSTNIRRGSLWSVSEDEAKWERWSHAPGEVCIQLYIAPAQIEATIAEIKQANLANRQIRVRVDCSVLAFRSEVDRSLAEPYHPQTYWFADEAFASVVLQRLTTTTGGDKADTPGTNDTADSISYAKLPSAAHPQYSMKALVIALWAIAVAIIFHALLR